MRHIQVTLQLPAQVSIPKCGERKGENYLQASKDLPGPKVGFACLGLTGTKRPLGQGLGRARLGCGETWRGVASPIYCESPHMRTRKMTTGEDDEVD